MNFLVWRNEYSIICRLMSSRAVVSKIRVLVICRAVGLKVFGLIITAEAVGFMSNTNGRVVRDSITALDSVGRIDMCGEMSSSTCRWMSNGAVDLKIRVLVIRGATGLKVVVVLL